jgi:hypothetical protein
MIPMFRVFSRGTWRAMFFFFSEDNTAGAGERADS